MTIKKKFIRKGVQISNREESRWCENVEVKRRKLAETMTHQSPWNKQKCKENFEGLWAESTELWDARGSNCSLGLEVCQRYVFFFFFFSMIFKLLRNTIMFYVWLNSDSNCSKWENFLFIYFPVYSLKNSKN